MVYGLVATFFCYACCELIKLLGLDDALDVWGVHGMGGWIGSILCLEHSSFRNPKLLFLNETSI